MRSIYQSLRVDTARPCSVRKKIRDLRLRSTFSTPSANNGLLHALCVLDQISIELLQKDGSLEAQEPWASMENTGVWKITGSYFFRSGTLNVIVARLSSPAR